MPDYDFRSLSPIDFETTVRDLLQEELQIRFESFTAGKDKGIDFRYCPSADKNTIVQCKHYVESAIDVLFRRLQKSELEKVIKLKPTRYILATSLGLTPAQKDSIKILFEPFIISTADILGREDINNLLGKFPKIEKRTFKLWFNSMPIFEEILHGKVKNISRDTLERIRLHAKYYVQNESFQKALQILDKQHFCIIAGIPGIGKTILAEMLCLYYIDQEYEMVKITGDISEARTLDHTIQKRIFYYDDFLGQTSLAEKFNKNEDQSLLDFIFTIRQSKLSKLILTTREYILNQARLAYEKIARERFDGETCVIDLSKYTRMNRAKILFNHIYFSDLPMTYKEALLRKRHYLQIIDHKNYNPRIIDLMTQFHRISHISPSAYFEDFMGHLENPLEIWRHAFEEQLSRQARHVLLVMVTLPEEIFLEDLEEAFHIFHSHQAKEYNFETTADDFVRAIKEVEGNFLSSEKSRDNTVIRFHNPSVRDFLEKYLSANDRVLHALIESATFFDQGLLLWESKGSDGSYTFRKAVMTSPRQFIHSVNKTLNSKSCRLINRGENKVVFKARGESSFEARSAFVVAVAAALDDESGVSLYRAVLRHVEDRIVSAQANREDLVSLFKELKRLNLVTQAERELLEKAEQFFMTDFDWFEDFRYFCDFSELFPEIISDADRMTVIKEFEEMVCSGLDYSDNDPDVYRNDAYEIDLVSKKLGLDMSDQVKELEIKADEIEAEAELSRGEIDGEYWSSGISDYCADSDIVSIFSTLI
ncbi:MAG: hypothetical protein C0402_10930 [Thermodesulfovibrio sp.]|nr:hypothetical protein [Thermodesulfovibrio sp.]